MSGLRRLQGKVALVTGAGQGIGKGLAERLAAEGCDVVVADLVYENAAAVAAGISAGAGRALALKVNIADESDVTTAFKRVMNEFGSLDILVNNAGVLHSKPIYDMESRDWDLSMSVNLRGTMLCTREAAKIMMERKSGRIINISSKSGKKGGLWLSAYSATKFGIIGLTQSAAMDLAPFGVTVNAICPGNVFETPLWDRLDKEYAVKLGIPAEQVRAKYVEKVPLGRSCDLQDVANVMVFLASDEASYLTGQAINVTGGQQMD